MQKSVILHAWAPADGLPSSSPYCIKALKALQYKRVPHELKIVKAGPPSWAKRGTLPVAEVGDRKVEDSTVILKELDSAFPDTPRLYPTDPLLRAETLVLEEWADTWLTLFVPFYRWTFDHHFLPFAKQAFSAMPGPVRLMIVPLIRKGFVKHIHSQWIGVDTPEVRVERFKEAIWTLEQRLSKNPFLIGAEPSAADFAVYPSLRIILNGKLHEISPHIEASQKVMTWIKAMDAL